MPDAGRADLDILVIGGGNAALNAAITARHAGAACWCWRARRSSFAAATVATPATSATCTTAPSSYVTGLYPEEEFWDDLLRVTGGKTNEELARLTIRESDDLDDWRPSTASAGSGRCGARSTWPAPTCSCSAAARR